MLEVQKFLQENSIDILQKELAIKIRRHKKYNNLICLNYDQIDSPKLHPIVRECRGLILDEENNFAIISYPFKRFFNYGENGENIIDWTTAQVYEKLDGSLVQMYWYDNQWNVATRGLPDASGEVGDFGFMFVDLIWSVFNKYEGYDLDNLEKDKCYMFELCTPYNRVVVPHKENKLILIGVRNLITLKEENITAYKNKFNICNTFPLNSWEEIVKSIDSLDGLNNEGFIVCDSKFNRCKIKSPQYVALSHLKEGLTNNKIIEIIRSGESDEFTTYFPEFKDTYSDIKNKYNNLIAEIEETYNKYKEIADQKEFALNVVPFSYSGILFGLRKGTFSSVKQGIKEINIDKVKTLLCLQ